ncbi:hepcidin-1 precursor [Salmo salar]|uniref:Hepcidin-1 n=1 Tax=Salmo salar TaxID=8030 RepID=B5X878_SALSA|nr:hepcidin-1 precursor [Salmo salar]ACI67048.1 Hepcidin-1 precursor [Salmo salar]|eukprot:NP_001134321.1 Hepcidin-1 precursor [Salmo salar]
MKAFSVAVAVVVVLACMFILESTAVPFSEVRTEEVESIDSPVGEHQQPGGTSMNLPMHFRFKRQSHLSLCRWCCNCCHNKGCGFCCKF